VISGFLKPLTAGWSKRVFSAGPQVDETNEQEFALGGGHAGIPFEATGNAATHNSSVCSDADWT
jgi:hypothetical protein